MRSIFFSKRRFGAYVKRKLLDTRVSTNRNTSIPGDSAPLQNERLLRIAEIVVGIAMTTLLVACHIAFFRCAGGLWRDETNGVHIATTVPVSKLMQNLRYDAFPLLWFLLLKAWNGIRLSHSDFGWRFLGLSVGLASVASLWLSHRALRAKEASISPINSLFLIGFCPMMIEVGDSIRGYGIGVVLLTTEIVATWRAIRRPSLMSWLLVCLLNVACVQFNFHNAIAILAIGLAAATVGMTQRRLLVVAGPLIAGATAAASMCFYTQTFSNWAQPRQSIALTAVLISWTNSLQELGFTDSNVLRASPLAHGQWLSGATWMLFLTFATAKAACTLNQKGPLALRRFVANSADHTSHTATSSCSSNSVKETVPERALFGMMAVAFILPVYAAALMRVGLIPYPRYFMTLNVVLGLMIQMLMVPFRDRLSFRWINLGIVAVLALVSSPAVVRASLTRATNVDLAARLLERESLAKDIILVSPWEIGVSFNYHYNGSTPWMTLPSLADNSVHRYDLYVNALNNRYLSRELTDRLSAIRNGGGRVWYVGSELWPSFDGPDQEAGLAGSGFGAFAAQTLLELYQNVDILPPLTNQRVREFEEVRVFQFSAPRPEEPRRGQPRD